MTAPQWKEMEDEALVLALAETRRDVVKARFAHASGRLENTASLRELRRQVARIRTELRRRESERGLAKSSLERAHAGQIGPAGDERRSEGGFLESVVDKLTS